MFGFLTPKTVPKPCCPQGTQQNAAMHFQVLEAPIAANTGPVLGIEESEFGDHGWWVGGPCALQLAPAELPMRMGQRFAQVPAAKGHGSVNGHELILQRQGHAEHLIWPKQ